MAKAPLDFSELAEVAELVRAITGGVRPAPPAAVPVPVPVPVPPAEAMADRVLAALATEDAPPPAPAAAFPVEPVEAVEPVEERRPIYRGDRLTQALASMCRRGGFTGAVVADDDGLPLAAHNSPVSAELVAAFTTVLGFALQKAGALLEQHRANNMSLDINFTDKAVLRRFEVSGVAYFLMLICPQGVDERSEIELSIEQICHILTAA